MAAYATYSYYTATFLGTAIAESNFPRLALRASAVIDQLTFNRAVAETDVDYIDKIKMAMCEVAEELQKQDAVDGADGVTSESVGAYSVSFGANSIKSQTNQTKLSNAARLWLANTDMMFAGFASGEYGGVPNAD